MISQANLQTPTTFAPNLFYVSALHVNRIWTARLFFSACFSWFIECLWRAGTQIFVDKFLFDGLTAREAIDLKEFFTPAPSSISLSRYCRISILN